mmetsp:Transcript_14694/g.26306  ORF Transcript_14694/g.26306 Transcript_14694/m.26306 type:complete len:536 (+) Transcript_14694:92-1699(+)|eukprot:CAMPEP_0184527056 /NCGR_PEP_ID=MMETSP0198_2-20121128/10992_1 /TAXON_ID=1112570 /ORGANISM="Thraustochytrium sp., Strain LLF1b" /LENGTH=535 /DNA_ID=CAMNT_0026918685 /DNA_START=90 /DNA_END=1697 /DNA_ORIENTATION=-
MRRLLSRLSERKRGGEQERREEEREEEREERKEEQAGGESAMETLFVARKKALQMQVHLESFHSMDYYLSHADSLEKVADDEFDKVLQEDEVVDPAEPIIRCREKNETSKIFQVLSGMPKGALLHTHGIATGPFEDLAEYLRSDERVYVYMGACDNGEIDHAFKYLSAKDGKKGEESGEWRRASSFSTEELLEYMVLPVDVKRKDLWPVFQHIWMRISELSDAIPIWKGENSFCWSMLTKLLATGVTYVEFKQLIPAGWINPSDDGKTVDRDASIDLFMDTFKDTVELFASKNPRFVGARIVWSALKVMDLKTVEGNTQTVLRLMEKYPHHVAGFDLVGHEDTLQPISMYADILTRFRDRGGRLLLHAGETIEPAADQIYDAIAVGSSRIGHAYSLPKFPALMRIVRDRAITIECCPLSNQGLGYVQDMRNHPGAIMVNNGLRLTISSDDAAIFGYSDLTHDFVVVAKSWGLKLSQLKHLCRQSFKSTGLSHDEQVVAEQRFDEDWVAFLKDFVGSEPSKSPKRAGSKRSSSKRS